MEFSVHTEEVSPTTSIIKLSGEVDIYTAPEFKNQLLEAIEKGARELIIDMAEVTFIDSTALGVLVGGVKRLRPSNGNLSLVYTDENIGKIFEITGLNRVFPIYSSREEALQKL